jgi:hypothetical protein
MHCRVDPPLTDDQGNYMEYENLVGEPLREAQKLGHIHTHPQNYLRDMQDDPMEDKRSERLGEGPSQESTLMDGSIEP